MTDPDITLSESQGIRYLHFGTPWIQGAMRIRRPWDIVIDYVALMQSWLLFIEPPRRLLQIGLGAGALSKHAYRYLPDTRLTVLEASASVAAAARQYFALPVNDSRLQVLIGDGGEFIAQPVRKPWGVIQVDVYDQEARGPVLESAAFYQACADALADPGIFCVNLFGEPETYPHNLARIQEAFQGRILQWPAVDAGNIVVLGFKGPPLSVSWADLQARAQVLEKAYDLPARAWLRSLKNHPARSRASTTHLTI